MKAHRFPTWIGAYTTRTLIAAALVAIATPAAAQTTTDDGCDDITVPPSLQRITEIPARVVRSNVSAAMAAARSVLDQRVREGYGWSDPVIEAYGQVQGPDSAKFPVYADMDLKEDGTPMARTPAQWAGQIDWVRYGNLSFSFWGQYAPQRSFGTFEPLFIQDPRGVADQEPDPSNPLQPVRRLDTPETELFKRRGLVHMPGYRTIVETGADGQPLENGKVVPDPFGLFLDQNVDDRWKNYRIEGMTGSAVENLVLNPDGAADPLDYATYGTQASRPGWTYVISPKFVKRITKKVDGAWVTEDNPLYDQSAVDNWDEHLSYEPFTINGETVLRPVARAFYGEAPGNLTDPEQIADARKKAERFRQDRSMERPIWTGSACSSCHTTINPIAMDPKNAEYYLENPDYPEMKHLSSVFGGQHFQQSSWFPHIPKDNLLHQLLNANRGANDTSRLTPPDQIDNPNTINMVAGLLSRLENAPTVKVYTDDEERWPFVQMMRTMPEPLKSFYDVPIQTEAGTGRQFVEIKTIRGLKTGGDSSVGVAAGFARVGHNEGDAWAHVQSRANLLAGIVPAVPMSIKDVIENSSVTRRTYEGVNNVVSFFLEAPTYRMTDLPSGREILQREGAIRPGFDLAQEPTVANGAFTKDWHEGMKIFANKCFSCHSAAQPGPEYGRDPLAAAQRFMAENIDDLRKNNFWANEREAYGDDVLKVNPARHLATNALYGLWANWSDDGDLFKTRPQIGPMRAVDASTLHVREGQAGFINYQSQHAGIGYGRSMPLNALPFRGPYGNANDIGIGSNDPATHADIQNWLTSTNIHDQWSLFKQVTHQFLNPEDRRGISSVAVTEGITWLPLGGEMAPYAINQFAASETFPWDGKTVDSETGWGINRMRLPEPLNQIFATKAGEITNLFYFKTRVGDSELPVEGEDTPRQSFILDYESPTCGEVRALLANPPSQWWRDRKRELAKRGLTAPLTCFGMPDSAKVNPEIITRIHDNIVVPITVRTTTHPEGVELFMGPAMLKVNDKLHELLYFALSPTNDEEALDVLAGMKSDQLRELYLNAPQVTDYEATLAQLTSGGGDPSGRMLAITGLEQGQTQGPIHELLDALGIDTPSLMLGPFPDGFPMALTNVREDKIEDVLRELTTSGVLLKWQKYKTDQTGLREFVFGEVVPILQGPNGANLKSPVYPRDWGHYMGLRAPRNGENWDPYFADPDVQPIPYGHSDRNLDDDNDPRKGELSPEDKRKLTLFLGTL